MALDTSKLTRINPEPFAHLDAAVQAIPDPETRHNASELVRMIAYGANWTALQATGGPNSAELAAGIDGTYPPFQPYTAT